MKTKRSWAKQIHSLAADDCPCGKIKFIHFRDGTEHTFGFSTNTLSNSILAWFDSDAPYVCEGHGWIKSVIKDIYKKSTKVIEHVGDYKPKA